MKITIVCVGKIKEKYLKDAIEEYEKRLSRYVKLEILEVMDEKSSENISDAEIEIIKAKEGEKVLKKIVKTKDSFVVALEIKGITFTSEEFGEFINNNMINSVKNLYFIIGGSLGIGKNVLNIVDYKISFSKMTFTHQFMRILLLEQIYRGYKIIKNEPYHK